MEVHVFDTYEEMSQAACDVICAQLCLKPRSHIGLTAGATPDLMFKLLVQAYKDKKVSFKDSTLYSLEEMWCEGLTKDHPATIYQDLGTHMVFHVDLPLERFIIPNCETTDPYAEVIKYTNTFDSLPDGRLDLQILGIGADAHIGMNLPAKELIGDCHVIEFTKEETQEYIDDYGVEVTKSMAMGVRNICQSKTILMIANGKKKAEAVKKMIQGDISSNAPASLLQLHPHVIVLLDKEAASLL